ncbi:MAG TPA: threonine-phosphate decarboxylase [Tissierellaceae bacterium]|nr:threonine-phosphate decarboxylase [Tissierellaceae bacterium]
MLHGGDLLTYGRKYKGELLDFSTNINPLGVPKGLYEKLFDEFSKLEIYPDIKYRKLKEAVSKYLGCDFENVLVGNGAVEIIDNFMIDAGRVIIVTPSFAEYELRAKVHKKEVISLPYKADFTVDTERIRQTIRREDLLVLGNPNNPTGLRIEKDTLLEIYKICEEKAAYLLLDEAFYEFGPMDYDSIELFKADEYKNVGIIRAATKFFALPGIRLGYGCASIDKVENISKVELPWSINALADKAGQLIFKDKEYIEKSRSYIDRERTLLLKELGKIQGLHAYPTHTNYILIRLDSWDEEYVFNFFLERGILVRKCSRFENLPSNHIRVAIRSRSMNERLLKVFKLLERGEKDEE